MTKQRIIILLLALTSNFHTIPISRNLSLLKNTEFLTTLTEGKENSTIVNTTEICDNGIDDDGDGYADCFDTDCPCYAPISCDHTLYQSIWVNDAYYNLFSTSFDPIGFDSLANLSDNGLGNIPSSFNSIAYNPVDQFIYGINPNPTTSSKYNLYRINGLGEVDNLGPISDDGDGNVDCEDDDCPCSATCPDEDGDGLLTVCRRNSANELGTTQTVTVEAWATTQGPFYYCGTCADYITVNNGDWNSSSTWRNGNVPPLSISGKMVRIVHNVDVTSGNITLDGGTQMTVDGSILDLVGDQFDLNVKSATVNISNGATVIVGDDLKMNNNNANIQVSGNSTLEARKRMAHTWGSVSLHNSTLLAGAGLGASRSFPEDYDKAIHIRNNAEIIGVNSSVILHHTLLMDGGTLT